MANPTPAQQKIIDSAKARFTRSLDAHSVSRESQVDDLKFAAGSPDNGWQWDPIAIANRNADPTAPRPMLTINQLPQHIRQVTNEERQNRPAGKVLPVDDKADVRTADIINGLIRHVEVSSDSDVAIDTATDDQVTHGEGYFRIVAEYCDPMSFDQDLRIKRIRNPFSVYDDPDIQDPVGCDRKFAFIVDELTKDEFEEQYPDADAVSWSLQGRGDDVTNWFNGEKIRVAEYYRVENEKGTLCAWVGSDGGIVTALKGSNTEAEYLQAGLQKVMKEGKPLERETLVPKIKWCKTNGHQILGKEKDIPGPFIPLFRVVGNEWLVEGEIVVSGIVRNAKDPQRMINYWTSQEAELLALAPKAPFVGAVGQFQGFESKWRQANVVPYAFLEYNPVTEEGTLVPPPQRMQPPMPSAGIIEAKLQANDALKQTTGQYNPSLGAQSNETSGKAIIARQRESDVGTYHYVDNLSRAVRAYSRYLVAVFPIYFDTARTARVLGEDGEADHAQLDPSLPVSYQEGEGGKPIYNLAVGKYDVVATAGPSYTTKRVEALDAMTQILQGNPELWAVMGDLLMKNMDWPGAEELSDRFRRTMDPKILGDEKGGEKDPRLEQMGTVIEQLTQALNEKTAALNSAEEKRKNYEAETKRIVALKDRIPPDMWPEIVVNSHILTSEDLDNISERGIVEPMPGGMPPPQPPAAAGAPPMQ